MLKRLLVAMFVCCAGSPAAQAKAGHANCSATITGSYADSCRDFAAHSSKDISYVKLFYVDGRTIKYEHINSHQWSIDGGPGDELDFARVKSGTTIEEFACEPGNAAPEAKLEIHTPSVDHTVDTCQHWTDGLLCEQSSPRTAWTGTDQIPVIGGQQGFFEWGCGGVSHPSLCQWTITFRGTGSVDADGDLASWSIDFGDGTTLNGTWSTPPAEVDHAYAPYGATCTGVFNGVSNVCVVTLTVTDSAGQSDSEMIGMVFLDQSPD